MDLKTSGFYAKNASKLAAQYMTADYALEERILAAFARSQKILDVGCGAGRDLSILLSKDKDAFGVDPSREMLNAACETLHVQGYKIR